ncbi:UTP--glucose-1-phosphate uridylyltransferase [Thermaerobacillus caldiproteolyticus]|uniref:UTP--glucose-1-phosphate uridylyltransferase n=1 Tax=Thermaerobacillus caldiproteolyticus TaxID=247480 RepID=A0A7V9Z6I5_9BACL|nr:UTP--glucose-1-phosphate uridylyltransferase [Anoxybacillus caldiproteolyticus]MBA2874955.1 UTP--glucose-1-phosphate uridylyltransferase [Anoxybacillus caldiproteolyticus]
MVKKAIIPAAGYGTRSLPITKVIPKEMFPIDMKPAIHYVVEEAIESGIEEILIIVSRTKNLIVDYFDHSLELEAFLEKQNKTHLLEKEFIPKVRIYYTRQSYARGLGDAVYLGKSFVGNEPFAVLLPDDIILNGTTPAIQQLVEEYKTYLQSVIGLNKVEDKHLHKYGVVKGEPLGNRMCKIVDIVEKPKTNPPSNLAVIGRYVFTPSIFSYLETLTMKEGEEIQLTDAIKKMSTAEACYGKSIEGNRFDIGSYDDYISLINIMNRPTKD